MVPETVWKCFWSLKKFFPRDRNLEGDFKSLTQHKYRLSRRRPNRVAFRMCPTYRGSQVSSDVKTQELIVELHTVLSIRTKPLQLNITHTHNNDNNKSWGYGR